MVIPWFYMGSVLYTIFQVKYNKDNWKDDEKWTGDDDDKTKVNSPTHEIRAWLLIECGAFFGWIACSVGFTLYAYIFKIKSICKNAKVMELDDNVWNDKDTDDFLRYLKFEYFMCTFFALKTVMELYIGFFPRDIFLIFDQEKEDEFGTVKIIFILLLV